MSGKELHKPSALYCHKKLSTQSIIENLGEIGLCWDYLSKIFNRDWSNTLLIIDDGKLVAVHDRSVGLAILQAY